MELKSPLTFVEQVNRLRAHGMLIESEIREIPFFKRNWIFSIVCKDFETAVNKEPVQNIGKCVLYRLFVFYRQVLIVNMKSAL